MFSITAASEQTIGEKAEDLAGKAKRATQQATDAVVSKLNETKIRRMANDYYVLVNYAPFDLIIPGKYGITLGTIESANKTWEFEYLHGSVSVPLVIEDLGKATDDRYSIMARKYFDGNSFNLSYGASYYDFSVHLGDKIMNNVSGGKYPAMDLVKIKSFGLNVALGNRWTFNHDMTVGIDWISWSQPLFITEKGDAFLDHATNSQDRDQVEKVINFVSRFPRFSVFKVQLGMLF